MDETLRALLDEEIRNDITELSGLEPGSDKKSRAIDDLVKLYKLGIEENKNDGELDEKYRANENEYRIKQEQLSEQVKDRYFRIGIEAAGIILPMIFYAAWMRKGFKFEETGTFTSTTFRGLFQKFKPTRK